MCCVCVCENIYIYIYVCALSANVFSQRLIQTGEVSLCVSERERERVCVCECVSAFICV